ncbi:hypothetical protein D3C72_1804610 [compost metagenome]
MRDQSAPRWFSQLVLNGRRILPKPSSLRRSCVRFRFSSPQRTCSLVITLPLPNFSCAARMASTCSMAIIMPRVCASWPSSLASDAVPWPLSYSMALTSSCTLSRSAVLWMVTVL